ncbi:MAG: hypothetical protein IT457_00075 [Planctomycetes bacterium]|nr:hypothetical protein [Planctomycetota bacterium]
MAHNGFAFAILLVASPVSFAQSMLRDVHGGFDVSPSGVWTVESAVSGGRLFFSANDQVHGDELWVSDGSAAGTRLVADLFPGTDGEWPTDLAAFAGGVVFTGRSALLWFSDGSAAGTLRLSTAMRSPGAPPLAVGNLLFFTAWTSAYPKLWVSDGTPAGTREVDPSNAQPVNPTQFAGVGATLYCVASNTGRVFRSDGSAAGTVEIAPAIDYGTAVELAAWSGRIVIASTRGTGSSVTGEIWLSDGSVAGTVRLATGFVGRPSGLRAFGSRFLFVADDGVHGAEMWVSDGSPAGTTLLLDITPNPGPTYPIGAAVVAGNLAFFRARDATHGVELFATDGTPAGTYLVRDIWNGVWDAYPSNLIAVGSRVFFRAQHWSYGEELWVSDGSASGTQLVADINPFGGASIWPLGVLGSRLVFRAIDGVRGAEAWISDGTAAGTVLLAELGRTALGSDPGEFAAFGARAVFAADDGTSGRELYLSDGSAAGTHVLADLAPGAEPSSPGEFLEWRGSLWFSASDVLAGRELWVSDGTAAGTSRFADLVLGPQGSNPAGLTALEARFVFAANGPEGLELWSSDGTRAGTVLIDIDAGSAAAPDSFVRWGDRVWFTANDAAHGRELWQTDGTVAGTLLVADLRPGPLGSRISGLTPCAGRLWFSGSVAHPTLDQDMEPWVSDGTAAGTYRVLDVLAGSESSSPSPFVEFAGRTWFTVAVRASDARDLWSSDGTAGGTLPFLAIGETGAELSVAGDRLFFIHQGEPWSTDGTPAGTAMVRDIIPGAGSSSPQQLLGLGASRLLLFSARTTPYGAEPWISDGSAAGTRVLAEIWPGARGSDPSSFSIATDHVFFSARSPDAGREPHAVAFAELGAALAAVLGNGCAGSAGVPRIAASGAPLLGDAGFRVALSQARAGAPCALLAGFALLPDGDRNACGAKISADVLFFASTDALGAAQMPVPIPLDTALLGLELYFHWVTADAGAGLFGALSSTALLDVVLGR